MIVFALILVGSKKRKAGESGRLSKKVSSSCWEGGASGGEDDDFEDSSKPKRPPKVGDVRSPGPDEDALEAWRAKAVALPEVGDFVWARLRFVGISKKGHEKSEHKNTWWPARVVTAMPEK